MNKFVHSTKASHPKSLLPTNLKIGGYNHYSKFNVKVKVGMEIHGSDRLDCIAK